eukprot:CAMPEP_0115872874 /NCGR_PEP_ID=MMETSP0287-20121206/23671_1 /TAXON_ID=412157 /ORGANISM="Chrysochromulina rotalis, Strain UIO044" /LENGTH=249 /DNA_ID=CAMNT_0003327849 /DNA_START=58 /DNA_END=807 /DNA_ORIENTATION=+
MTMRKRGDPGKYRIVVQSVVEGSAAAQAGVQAEDTVIAVNGRPVQHAHHARSVIEGIVISSQRSRKSADAPAMPVVLTVSGSACQDALAAAKPTGQDSFARMAAAQQMADDASATAAEAALRLRSIAAEADSALASVADNAPAAEADRAIAVVDDGSMTSDADASNCSPLIDADAEDAFEAMLAGRDTNALSISEVSDYLLQRGDIELPELAKILGGLDRNGDGVIDRTEWHAGWRRVVLPMLTSHVTA